MALIDDVKQSLGPEKEAQIKQGYKLGKNLIYKKDVFDSLMSQIEEMSPPAAMAEAIVLLLEKIQGDMKAPFDVLFGIGLVLMADLAEALNRTGRFNLTGDDISKAVELGVYQYLQAHGSEFDQDELRAQAEQGMAQMAPQQQGAM